MVFNLDITIHNNIAINSIGVTISQLIGIKSINIVFTKHSKL